MVLLQPKPQIRGARRRDIDCRRKMIELAPATEPGIDFREADVEPSPFPDDTFDGLLPLSARDISGQKFAVAGLSDLVNGGRCISGGMIRRRQRIQGIFRDAIFRGWRVGAGGGPRATMPIVSQHGRVVGLLEGAWLSRVAVTEHAGDLSSDTETLWRLVAWADLIWSRRAIRQQDKATQDLADRVRAFAPAL